MSIPSYASSVPKSFLAYPGSDFDLESGTIRRIRKPKSSQLHPVKMLKSFGNRVRYFYKLHPFLAFLISLSFGITILVIISIYQSRYSAVGSYREFDVSLENYPFANLKNLVMVAGHSIYTSKSCEKVDKEDSWFLEPYQKNPGQAATFLAHIEQGIEITAKDEMALLLFSGGETRKDAGPRSEAQSYWAVAESRGWFGKEENVRSRALTEEHARDSFENLLFSVCRFRELTGRYPSNITVVSYDFKEERFAHLHRAAVSVCLRFAGYSLPQEAHDKLWSLIHHSLHSEANGYERVFRVIEVELAFLFDLFYTNFSVTPSPRRIISKVLQLVGLLVFSRAIISSYQKYQIESIRSTHDDALVTFSMMIAILGIEIVQFSIRVFSEWAKVSYICMYVRNEWCQRNRIAEKVIEIMCGIKLRKPWGGQLQQYSLLEKCSYRPPKLIFNSITAEYFDQAKDGQRVIAPTKLSKEVMKAIARSLMNNGTRNLENGRASLRRNNMFDQLSWACNLESTTRVIMVWHIATSIYEYEQRRAVPSPLVSQGQRENFNIATTLSKYLAYLVAFAPRLLPDHRYRSEYIFGRVVKEARELFKGSSILMDERIQKLKALDNEQYSKTIVGQGTRLGSQLSIQATDDEHIWTILADFWAEMMLYVAPSNDVGAHAKYLSTGGEFVTHVWVLLSHAGIMRSPDGSEQHDDPERY